MEQGRGATLGPAHGGTFRTAVLHASEDRAAAYAETNRLHQCPPEFLAMAASSPGRGPRRGPQLGAYSGGRE
eukprot:10829933-Lingulodinium_polyedra.AAC.1